MIGRIIFLFLKDRLFFVGLYFIVTGLGIGFLLLERARNPGVEDIGIIGYFIILCLFFLVLWLAVDFIRQKSYFSQLFEAIERDGAHAAEIVQTVSTNEQHHVVKLLNRQNSGYLNELREHRRQQELHNHFVLQWVHHMKTPVSVIDMLAQEAVQQIPYTVEEQTRLVESIKEEVERMTKDLDMMLYTARLDKFEIDLHLERIPLHTLIREVINNHKRLCIRYSIFPKIDGKTWIETDRKWMTFVLEQFVTNAIKYSKSKSGTKLLYFCIVGNHDGSCKMSVTDDGIGIAPYDIPRIFEPFFTGENGRTAGESTGMGLYLVNQVCKRLGHGLTVESKFGEGTTFTISFEPSGIHLFNNK